MGGGDNWGREKLVGGFLVRFFGFFNGLSAFSFRFVFWDRESTL